MDEQEARDEKAGRVTGIVDVGIIAIAHFKNPAREKAFKFLSKVLRGEKKCLVPLTTFLGAYHVMTEYLGVIRTQAERALRKTVETRSPSFYESVGHENVLDALSSACDYNIESWDGYIISLAREYEASLIYTIDEKMDPETEEIEAVNPIPADVFSEYQEWLQKRL